jgi:hypothetical protein
MQTPRAYRAEIQTDGIVRAVDVVNRELSALAGGALVSFSVPPGCVVVLRGEQVKLRMVQPGDRVRVTYAEERGSLVARVVEAQPGHPPFGISR